MGSEFGFTSLSTHADSQKGQKYKPVAVQWRGTEAWQLNPRTAAFPDKYKEKQGKQSKLEKNTAQSFDMAVGTGNLGSIYGDNLTITDLDGSTSTGGSSSAGGGGGYGGDLVAGIDWGRWAPVALGGALIAFLLYQYSKGRKNVG